MYNSILVLGTVCILGLVSMKAHADERDDKGQTEVSLEQLPAPVQAAILKTTKGTKIEAIERETKEGRTLFDVEASRAGVAFDLTFDQHGALVSFAVEDEEDGDDEARTDGEVEQGEEVIPLSKAPSAAREALVKQAGSAKIKEVVVQNHDGVKLYEAAWESNGSGHEALVTATGDLVVLEEVISASDAPEAVRKTADKAFPKRAELVFEKRTVILYEVGAQVDGKEKLVIVSPTGQRFDQEENDESDK